MLTTLLQALARDVAVRQLRALFESHIWTLWTCLHASSAMLSRTKLILECETWQLTQAGKFDTGIGAGGSSEAATSPAQD